MVQYPCPWLKGLLLEALKEADFGDYVGFVEVSCFYSTPGIVKGMFVSLSFGQHKE